jgi:AmmeMemoRadiSam system protein B
MNGIIVNGIKYPSVAGTFYPADKEELIKMLKNFENQVKEEVEEFIANHEINEIKALISPHAGYIYSGIVAMYGYKLLYFFKKEIKDVLIAGPSHYAYFYDFIQPSFKHWLTPLGKVKVKHLSFLPKVDEPFIPEHSVEVQIPFLQYFYKDYFNLTPLLAGEVHDLEFFNRVKNYYELFVISSDLSHYLPYEEAVKRDLRTIEFILKKDIKGFIKYGDACGREAIKSLLITAKKENWNVALLKYLNSGDTAGTKEQVVGYASIVFYK